MNRGYKNQGGEGKRDNLPMEFEDDGNGGITNEDRDNLENADQAMH